MKLQTAIKQATAHLLKSDKARTYTVTDGFGHSHRYVVELERDRSGDPEWTNWLDITTWGFDYEGIKIPQTRPELINLKMRAQMGMGDSRTDQIAKRYYLDILIRESR